VTAASKALAPIVETIRRRTDEFCRTSLTAEYALLCRELTDTLARKRPSPFSRGRPDTWACAVAYTIGSVNFLFDPAQDPHLSARAVCAAFGVSQSAASARSREIQHLLRIIPLDARWCLPSKLADNPLAWMISVNGVIVDARMMSRDFQEEAYRRGFIPFLPD
jgi:hypothetical protein